MQCSHRGTAAHAARDAIEAMLLYLLLASLRGALPVVAAPRKTGEETPGQLRSKADEALLKKDTDTALSLLARAIKLEPDN